MVDKRIVTHDMMIACLLCPVAEIIFFPVTSAEGFGIKHTDGIDQSALDVHAESDCNGDRRITFQAARFDQSGILIDGHIFRNRIVLAHDRHGA